MIGRIKDGGLSMPDFDTIDKTLKACQSRKSDFGWHRFCFSPFWMRKRVIKAQAILALLDSFQELHLEIW